MIFLWECPFLIRSSFVSMSIQLNQQQSKQNSLVFWRKRVKGARKPHKMLKPFFFHELYWYSFNSAAFLELNMMSEWMSLLKFCFFPLFLHGRTCYLEQAVCRVLPLGLSELYLFPGMRISFGPSSHTLQPYVRNDTSCAKDSSLLHIPPKLLWLQYFKMSH